MRTLANSLLMAWFFVSLSRCAKPCGRTASKFTFVLRRRQTLTGRKVKHNKKPRTYFHKIENVNRFLLVRACVRR